MLLNMHKSRMVFLLQDNILYIMIYRYFLRKDEEFEERIEQLKQSMRHHKTDQSLYYHEIAETMLQQRFFREIAKDINTILHLYYK